MQANKEKNEEFPERDEKRPKYRYKYKSKREHDLRESKWTACFS